jgi:hypothetical protein
MSYSFMWALYRGPIIFWILLLMMLIVVLMEWDKYV